MKVEFWMTGKTTHEYLRDPMGLFKKRIGAYIPFEIKELKISRAKAASQIKQAEEEAVLKLLQPTDHLILLDEKGQEFNSAGFSRYLQKTMNMSAQKIIFLAGGAYGFTETIYQRAQDRIALSKMTFTHEMVRIIFLEQLYRALTILNNHPYHN